VLSISDRLQGEDSEVSASLMQTLNASACA
jgi:hypothetical protein